MTLSQIAAIADLVAAAGVIASLIFVGLEMRKNAAQARLSNWFSVLGALREHKRRTDTHEMAAVVAAGRQDYAGPSEAEKIMFGNWMEEMLQAQEGLLQYSDVSVIQREQLVRTASANLRWHFGFPGCRDWWRDSNLASRWPKLLVTAVTEATTWNEAPDRP